MKIAYLSFLALGFAIISSSSASAANRFAVASGNWNATTTWAATSGGAPGVSAPVAGDDVFIGEGSTNRTVTIPTGVSAACTSLAMGTNTDNTVATLNFATNTSTLAVSGNLTMIRPGGNAVSTIGLGAGSLTVNGILTLANHADSSTAAGRVNSITISTGTLIVVGNLVFEAQDSGGLQSQVVFSGAGTMNLKSNLTFTNNLGLITPSTSTVDLNGSGSQTIDGSGQSTFNNLTVSNTGGTVTLSDNQTVGAALTVKAGATLALATFNLGTPTSLTMEIGSTGASITSTTGTLSLGGNVTVSTTAGSSGASISAKVALGATRTFTVADDGTSATDLTVSGVISGATFGITKAGAGTMTVSGTNTYSGTTTLSAGTLNINNAGAGGTSSSIGTGAFTINGGTVDNTSGGAITLSTNNTVTWGADFTFGGTQNLNLGTGGVSVSLTSTKTITLNGTSSTLTFGGTVTNTGVSGTLTVNGVGNTLSLGGFNLSNSSTTRTLTVGGSGNTAITGVVANGGTATSGNLTYSGSATLTLSGTNTYTGVTTITSGTLSVGTIGNGGVAGNLGQATNSAANLVFGGGTLQYTGATASTNRAFTLTAATTSSIDVTTNNLTISGASANTTGALTKIGAGTLTLSGANAYTGTTTVNAGTLAYGASNVISTGAVTVDGATAVLSMGTNSDSVGTVTVDNSGSITSSTGVLTSTGTFEMKSGSVSAILAGSGIALNKTTAGTVTLSGVNTYTGVTTINAGVLSVATINNGGVAGNLGQAAVAAANLVLGGGTLQYTGATASTNRAFTLTAATTSTFDVTVGANTLTISGASVSTTGSLTKIGAGTLAFGTNPLTLKNLTISAGTLADGGSTITVNADVANSGTHTGAGKILLTGGSAAHALTGAGGSYRNLELNDSLGATLTGTATITGNLALTSATGDITVTSGGSNTLFMGIGSTSSGVGDVVGKVNRTDNGPFGNQNVIISKTAGTVTSFDVTLVKGTSSLQTGVKRVYVITPNGGSSLVATLRLRYLDSERNNNSENTGAPCNLQLWKETGTTWVAQGSTDCKATDDNNRWVELTGVVSFSPWTIAGLDAPTACKLEGFQAARSDEGVVLEWRTGYEVNNVGFNIYRQGSDGEMVKLTKHMVAGSGLMVRKNTALTSGLSYYWSDPDTKKGDHPQYWLEDLDADGHTSWNGPFIINEAAIPTRPTPGGKAAPGEKGGRGDANSMTINSISEENEQSGAYQPSGPVESTAKVGKMKLAAAIQQADLAGKPAVKISIKREGWYRITQAQLVAAGISTSTDVKKLQLFVDSQEIPIIVGGGGRGFDPSAYIEFYGQGLDTPSTDTRVYWLIVGTNGLRIKSFTGLGGGSAGDSFQYTVQRKDRLFYRSEIQNGDAENFFGAFIYYQPTDQALTVNRIAPAANTTLEIALQGFNAGPHQVQVSLNGAIVGSLSFNDRVRQVFTLTAPQALLTEGANKVTLQALAGSSDFSFVDYIKLTYAHKWEAENNALKFTAPGSSVVTLNGFTGGNIRVVDVTDPKAVQELLAKPSQGNTTPTTSITVATSGGGTRSLLAFVDTKQAAKVAANKPSSLRLSSNQADLVIIGAGDFSSSLQSLQSLRQGQGIQTMLVDVEDVYDEFSFGQKSPNALKDFLSYARTNWKKAPKYVLLGGMASFDPRNYMSLGNTDFVPTKIVMTEHLETASDDWFVDFNNDGMPEMALGRLPARNADEAARMVQKLVNYDQAASGAGVLLVADVNKGFDFEHNNDLLKAIVPGTTAVQDIRRASDPQAKQTLLTALNQGKKLVNYTGHGSVDIWEASLLTSTDAAGLGNAQKLSLVVAMTCLNGYFFDERFESLAHALINAQNGGAVAVWSSTGLTEPDPQSLADQELFRQLFAGASVRLGDAALKAKAVITDSDVRRTWVLIGDPTMRFKQ